MTEQRSDGVSGNGRNGGNVGGRFGRDGMRFGFNGKVMEWNMVHDKRWEDSGIEEHYKVGSLIPRSCLCVS